MASFFHVPCHYYSMCHGILTMHLPWQFVWSFCLCYFTYMGILLRKRWQFWWNYQGKMEHAFAMATFDQFFITSHSWQISFMVKLIKKTRQILNMNFVMAIFLIIFLCYFHIHDNFITQKMAFSLKLTLQNETCICDGNIWSIFYYFTFLANFM